MSVAEVFIKCLENEGVEYIFGLPGEENADLVIELKKSTKIKFVLTRHEQAAAFMADCYGRQTGKPGVCLGTLGPGATNLVTGVADANMDCAPLIVITGQAATSRLHKESHQNMDVVKMFEPITKWAVSIVDPGSVAEIIRKGFKLATEEKPGAVHIELPEDIAKRPVPEADQVPLPHTKIRRAVIDDKVADKAWSLLASAKKPVILAGNGAIRKGASKMLREFCELTGVGVLNTFMAKGLVDMDSPQCLFTVGLGSGDYNNLAIADADVVFCIGFQLVEYHAAKWNPKRNKCVVHCDFHQAEVDKFYLPEIELVGDISHTLWMLNERARAHGKLEYDLSNQAKVRKMMLDDFAEHANDTGGPKIRPQKFLWDLRKVLPADGFCLSDVGAHKMWIARHFQAHNPNTVMISNGFCSMGFALPGAVGVALANPGKSVVAVCGDGGFMMNVQDMETITRLKLRIVVTIFVDSAYGLIIWKQENEFKQHSPLDFTNPDFMLLAKAFGWDGFHAEKAEDVAGTLEKALACEGPALVTIPIDYDENVKLSKKLGAIDCDL